MKRLIILDPGHGSNTPGKCSPKVPKANTDPAFAAKLPYKEYKYVRQMADMLEEKLKAAGYAVERTTRYMNDLSLASRVKFANSLAKGVKGNALFISLHTNAAKNGGWSNAQGWEVYVAKIASQTSRDFATVMATEAAKLGCFLRKGLGGRLYKERDLYVVRNTTMPAVLVESFFHDSEREVAYALTEVGLEKYVDIIYRAITRFNP